MARRYVVAGSTGQSFNVFLQDRSSGDGVISMTTSNVKAAYAIGTSGAITTFALQSTTRAAPWVSGGWVENSSVNMPGVYRMDPPDASIATTPSVTYFLQCSTPGANFLPVALEVQVVSSGGSDMPSDFITYKGMAQTSVNIGAMLTSVNAKVTSVDSRLSSMDTMLSSVNSKVTSIDAHATSIDSRLTSMDTMLTSVNSHVTSIDSRLSSMDTMLSSVNSKVTSIDAHATSIDSRLSSMDTMLSSVNAKVTSVDTKVSSMNTQVTSILANVTSINAKVTSIDSRLTSMDTMLSSVNAKVTSVDSRLTSMDTMLTSVNSYTTSKTAIADAFLDRDMSTGTDSGTSAFRTPRQALRFLRNKWTVSGGTLTVYKEDDTNASWTAAVTTDATADPITASDPDG